MNNNKQSSVVDFIYNELFVVKRWMDLTPGDIEYIFNQAKAMHKEEIVKAYNQSWHLRDKPYETAEKYYNETFGGNNEQ